ncbi:MAG: hypothetical protein ACLFUH_09110 [Bacteroidales bacterium]
MRLNLKVKLCPPDLREAYAPLELKLLNYYVLFAAFTRGKSSPAAAGVRGRAREPSSCFLMADFHFVYKSVIYDSPD